MATKQRRVRTIIVRDDDERMLGGIARGDDELWRWTTYPAIGGTKEGVEDTLREAVEALMESIHEDE